MVYINTLMIQQVLTDKAWWVRMTPDDLRALTPLIYATCDSLWDLQIGYAGAASPGSGLTRKTVSDVVYEAVLATLPRVTARII